MDHRNRLFAIVSIGLTAACSAATQAPTKTSATPRAGSAESTAAAKAQQGPFEKPAAGTAGASSREDTSVKGGVAAAPEQKRLKRDALIRAVLRRNPTLQARKRAYQAARAVERQVTALDDPMLSYSLAPLSIGSNDVGFGQAIQVSQRLPWPGKLSGRGQAAKARAVAAQEEIEVTELELALITSSLLDNYYYVEQALEINLDHQNLVRDLKRSAEVQYSVGKGSLQDPLQAEVQLTHLIHQEVVLGAEREVIQAQLNSLLHYPPDRALPAPPEELEVELDWLPKTQPGAALYREALKRAEFRAARARIRAAEADTAVAEREYYPDFSVMASYNSMWAMPEHQWMVGVEVPIPIQLGRRSAAVEQAQATAAKVRSELSALRDDVLRDVQVSMLKLNEAKHVARLYRSRLIPAARDQVAAARSGYQSGMNSFVTVIDAEKNLRSVRLDYVKAMANLSTRRAKLQRELGHVPGLRETGSKRSAGARQ